MITEPIVWSRTGLAADCSPHGDPNHFSLDPRCGADAVPQLNVIVGYVAWAATFIAILALFAVAVLWAYNTHNGEQENLRALGRWGAGCLILGGSGQLVNSVFGFNLFNPHPQAIPGLSAVQLWLNRAAWVAGIVCAMGFIFVAIQCFRNHRNGNPIGEGLVTVTTSLFLVSGATVVTYAMLPW